MEEFFFLADFTIGNGDNESSIKYMKKAIDGGAQLTSDLHDLFIAPYREVSRSLRDNLKSVSVELASEELESEEQVHALGVLKTDYTDRLLDLCKGVIATIKDKLLPAAQDADKPKLHLFIADFSRYAAELEIPDAGDYVSQSHENYEAALNGANELLPLSHPVRLNAANNLSILLNDIMDKVDDAIELVQAIYNECIGHYEDLEEEDVEAAKKILETMRDNVVQWSGAEP